MSSAAEKEMFARQLRRNPTAAEDALWCMLRDGLAGYRFRRQYVLDGWIADFYCPAARLVIEVDGASHRGREDADRRRDEVMRANWYRVVRFPNYEVTTDIDSVVARIQHAVDNPASRQRQQRFQARGKPGPTPEVRKALVEEARRAGIVPGLSTRAQPGTVNVTPRLPRKMPFQEPRAKFRCEGCQRTFVAAISPAPRCLRCSRSALARLCRECDRRPARSGSIFCSICEDASFVARQAVGRGQDPFGIRAHRATKV